MLFPNPETNWHSEKIDDAIDTQCVRDRIGEVDGSVTRLSGGLANENLLIGDDRVLRIYKRDPESLGLEHTLLTSWWSHFRVPRVLQRGDDFLVLEYVEHRPLVNTAESGHAAGLALAEVHDVTFDTCGQFDETLEIAEPWTDFPQQIESYVSSHREKCSRHRQPVEAATALVAASRREMESACQQAVLLHGDFKASNLHLAKDDQLLVLDWEFAYAGPAIMDVGQLFRWDRPEPFTTSFLQAYMSGGGKLASNWSEQIAYFDVVNLIGLLVKSEPGSQQETDCLRRISDYCS